MASGARAVWWKRGLVLGSVLLLPSGVAGVANTTGRSGSAPILFAEKWIDGTDAAEPAAQVQALDPDTFVIRQSLRTNFEGPFLYLIFGRDKALLVDTGAEGGQLRPVVDRIVSGWLEANRRTSIPLVVAHSHSHGDHVAGDASFRGRSGTVVIGLKPDDVAKFFGIARWPEGIATFDLGGRALSIIPTPGHQAASIMIYDPRLRILLTGDVLYPGRLYIPVNFVADGRASVDRLANFVTAHPVRAVLGAHIEMTRTPGKDYAQGAISHPDEHRLELPATAIAELQAGLAAPLRVPDGRRVRDSFIIQPVAARPD